MKTLKRRLTNEKTFLFILCVLLTLTACGADFTTTSDQSEESTSGNVVENTETWQDYYDLGVRYLSEGNYEEAIIAFTCAIEIDPKQPELYINRGDAYVGLASLSAGSDENNGIDGDALENYQHALSDYLQATALDSTITDAYRKAAETYILLGDVDAAIELLWNGVDVTADEQLKTELENAISVALKPIVSELDIQFTVDDIVLGVSDIETAKAIYGSRPYAMSNLMYDGSVDTVYKCFGLGDTPIPEGYHEMEFGFLFAAPIENRIIYLIWIQDNSFLCFDTLKIGNDAALAIEQFGLDSIVHILDKLDMSIICKIDDNHSFSFDGTANNFYLEYCDNGRKATVRAVDGIIHRIELELY